jgi:hypothetical protein
MLIVMSRVVLLVEISGNRSVVDVGEDSRREACLCLDLLLGVFSVIIILPLIHIT